MKHEPKNARKPHGNACYAGYLQNVIVASSDQFTSHYKNEFGNISTSWMFTDSIVFLSQNSVASRNTNLDSNSKGSLTQGNLPRLCGDLIAIFKSFCRGKNVFAQLDLWFLLSRKSFKIRFKIRASSKQRRFHSGRLASVELNSYTRNFIRHLKSQHITCKNCLNASLAPALALSSWPHLFQTLENAIHRINHYSADTSVEKEPGRTTEETRPEIFL